MNEENAEEEIREAFRVFDGDGNGFIDRLKRQNTNLNLVDKESLRE